MTPENARINAAEEARQGREALAEAEHLLTGGFFKGAISRTYFAVFHFARAVLLLKGLEPKTHAGLIRLFSLHYVKSGIVEENTADYLARLETLREISDYDPMVSFTKEEAEQKIGLAKTFIGVCKDLLIESGVQLD